MNVMKLETFEENGYHIYRVPCIVCTGRGTLLVTYEARHGGDWSAMDMMLRRSIDGGRTWSERRILAAGNGVDAVHNGILFADGGTVHFLFHRNYRRLFYCRSTDDGATWSAPREISGAYEELRARYNWTVIAAGPAHGTVLRNGTLLIPVWAVSNPREITSHHPSVVTTLYSRDRGESWHCGEIIPASEEFVDPNESILVELSDGRVLINSRHETPGQCFRKIGGSPDGISEWGGFRFEAQLVDPVCAASMVRSEDAVWFLNCRSQRNEGRIRMTVRESSDDCRSWTKELMIAPLGGYSDICYDPAARMLHAVVESGRHTQDKFSFDLEVISFSRDELQAAVPPPGSDHDCSI